MPTFLFLAAICLLVAASILLETDASPKPDKKREKGPSSGNAEPKAGQPSQNQWDSAAAACQKGLTLSSDQLIVEFTGKKSDHRSVRAEWPIPTGNSGIFYYEVTILEKKDDYAIYIGLATKKLPEVHVGFDEGTYGYGSLGNFWGYDAERCSRWVCENDGRHYIEGKPTFEEGNVVGCGVDLKSRKIIFTKNGVLLETADWSVADSAGDLYPCVTLYEPDTKIEANFGPENFRFDIAKAFEN